MKGRLYIDTIDAFEEWGVYVIQGGWNELLAYPPLKTPESNDWQEEDGIEADLSAPRLNTKEATVRFAYSGLYGNLLRFIEKLSDGAYHTFEAVSIKRRFTLRMTQMPNLDMLETFGILSLKLANDLPLDGYFYQQPQSSIGRSEDYLLDGRAFTDYGCRILQGSLAEVVKAPAVKQNLLRNIPSLPGAIYDPERVTFKSKDVKLNCLMRAKTLEELWRNYDALLYDLIRPEERLLEVTELGHLFPAHYKSASVTEFYPDGKIWLIFTLTLTLTNSFRIDDPGCVLWTEDGIVMVGTDADTAIELVPTEEETGNLLTIEQGTVMLGKEADAAIELDI